MLDDFNSADRRTDGGRAPRQGGEQAPARLSDREVPLSPRRTPAVVQAWLDGDVSKSEAIRADAGKDVEFWNNINEQAAARRHMRTPVHVQQRILAEISRSTPVVEASWMQQQTHVTRGTLILLAGGVLAAGLALGALILAR